MSPDDNTSISPRRTRIFQVVILIGTYLSLELIIRSVFLPMPRVVYRPMESLIAKGHRSILEEFIETGGRYLRFDQDLGWTMKENIQDHDVSTCRRGSRRKDDPWPLDGDELVMASFGDSFTMCDDVRDKESWQAYLEERIGGRQLNFGVSGFGLDQAYLRYERKRSLHRYDIVFIGFFSDNIARSVNTFRPFCAPRTGLPLAKPRFLLTPDGLELLPPGVRRVEDYRVLIAGGSEMMKMLDRLGEKDAFAAAYFKRGSWDRIPSVRILTHRRIGRDLFRPDGTYHRETEAYRVTRRLMHRFAGRVLEEGSLPVIVLYPSAEDLLAPQANYAPLQADLESDGWPVVNLADFFDGAEEPVEHWIPAHFSKEGNRRIAEGLEDWLRQKGWSQRPAIQEEVRRRLSR